MINLQTSLIWDKQKLVSNYFKHGLNSNIPICCILFFMYEWQNIKKSIPEYLELMHKITNNEGVILCPDCIVKHHKANAKQKIKSSL